MDVNFEYYKIFYYVARYKNFTKAAQALGSSQPNVTRAMNCLEQQINSTLFVRNNRGIQLTPEGEKLYIRVTAAMTQLMAAEEELADSASLSHGSISIGASETALNIFLLDKLKAFHMVNPGIRLKIYNHSTPEAVDAVKKWTGRLCSGIITCVRRFITKDGGVAFFSGNTCRRNYIYSIGKSGIINKRIDGLSTDMPWQRDYDIQIL